MNETLPENIEDITIEAVSETEYFYDIDISTEAQTFNDEEQSEIASLYAQYFLDEDIQIEDIYAAVQQRASNSVTFTDSDFIFTIDTGDRSYRVLFPETSRESLEIRDNVLINLSANNITGLILGNDDSAATNTYHAQYLTLVPFTQTGGNNNAYRYGAYAYITTYTPGVNNSLTSTVAYVKPSVTEKPGLFGGFTDFQLIVMFCLGLTILISFFGGLFRR